MKRRRDWKRNYFPWARYGDCLSRSRDHHSAKIEPPLKKHLSLKMSTAVVRAALCTLLADEDCLSSVECVKQVREEVKQFLQVITQDDKRLGQFDTFASKLMKMLEKCFFGCVSESAECRSKQVKREKMWTAFHQLWIGELSKLWKGLFSCGFPKLSPLAYQQVNRKLYSDLILCHMSEKAYDNAIDIPPLTGDEENIIRYVAGYVASKLLKTYEKDSSAESVSVIECLSAMARKVILWSTQQNG